MSIIEYAVIPVAGLGTRMRPASRSIPKEMITLVDRPVIDYVVNEAIQAGIKNIVLVTRDGKSSIEDYFSGPMVLPNDVNIISVRQSEALGLGHAVLAAEPVVKNKPFAVLLPDVVVENSSNLKDMIKLFANKGRYSLLVQKVKPIDVSKYGIVDVVQDTSSGNFSAKEIKGLIEKPSIEDAPSNLAIVGRYILSPSIFGCLRKTNFGAGGEIQLTDAIIQDMKSKSYYSYTLTGKTFDCGNKLGLFEATLHYAERHPEFGSRMRVAIQEAAENME